MLDTMLKDTKKTHNGHCGHYGRNCFTLYILFKRRVVEKHGRKNIGRC